MNIRIVDNRIENARQENEDTKIPEEKPKDVEDKKVEA
jgi:hypothetical protein